MGVHEHSYKGPAPKAGDIVALQPRSHFGVKITSFVRVDDDEISEKSNTGNIDYIVDCAPTTTVDDAACLPNHAVLVDEIDVLPSDHVIVKRFTSDDFVQMYEFVVFRTPFDVGMQDNQTASSGTKFEARGGGTFEVNADVDEVFVLDCNADCELQCFNPRDLEDQGGTEDFVDPNRSPLEYWFNQEEINYSHISKGDVIGTWWQTDAAMYCLEGTVDKETQIGWHTKGGVPVAVKPSHASDEYGEPLSYMRLQAKSTLPAVDWSLERDFRGIQPGNFIAVRAFTEDAVLTTMGIVDEVNDAGVFSLGGEPLHLAANTTSQCYTAYNSDSNTQR